MCGIFFHQGSLSLNFYYFFLFQPIIIAVEKLVNLSRPPAFTRKDVKAGGIPEVVKYIQHMLFGNIEYFLLDMKLYEAGNELGECLFSE